LLFALKLKLSVVYFMNQINFDNIFRISFLFKFKNLFFSVLTLYQIVYPWRMFKTYCINVPFFQRIAEVTEILESRELKLIEMSRINVDLQESNSDLKRYFSLLIMWGSLFEINYALISCFSPLLGCVVYCLWKNTALIPEEIYCLCCNTKWPSTT
jgi:hypothetical protein